MPQHDGARLAPPAGRLLNSRKEIEKWLAEHRATLPALTFEGYGRLTALLSPHWRTALHARLPESVQAQAWTALREQAEQEPAHPPGEVVALRRDRFEDRAA